LTEKKKHYIRIDPDNYWDTCNVQVRYEYGGAWHNEPPQGKHTVVKIDWYKEKDDDSRIDSPWKPNYE
jgi:hypothetical protein